MTYDDVPSPEEESTADRSLFNRWGWPLFGLAAIVVFELTADIQWTAIVFALRFGWRDGYAAWRFLWSEQLSPRGWSLALILMSSATSKVFLACFGTMIGLLVILGPPGKPGGNNVMEPAFNVIGVLFLSGIAASGICGVVGTCLAWFHGLRLWVDQQTYDQAREWTWPPRQYTANRLPRIFLYMMIPVTGLLLTLTMAIPMVLLLDPLQRQGAEWPIYFFLASPLLSIFVFLYTIRWLNGKLVAPWPFDCWPELTSQGEDELIRILVEVRQYQQEHRGSNRPALPVVLVDSPKRDYDRDLG